MKNLFASNSNPSFQNLFVIKLEKLQKIIWKDAKEVQTAVLVKLTFKQETQNWR